MLGMDATNLIEVSTMRLIDFFEDNYRVKKLRGKSPHTLRLYRFSIRHLGKVLCKDPELSDLNDENVALVMQSIIDRGCSPYTANKERSQLLAIWRYAAQIGELSRWPTVMAENEPERIPRAWTIEDVQQLFASVRAMQSTIGDVQAAVWWEAIVMVCLDTGERIGAVSQAEWSWLERSWLLVPAEARKGRKRDRRYLLSNETLALLSELRKQSPEKKEMFAWPYCSTYLWAKYSALLRKAGLPSGPKDKFHKLRKTTASVAYAAGLDAQDLLDHQNKRTTQKYLDPQFTRETQASQVIADWLRNPPKADKRKQA